MLAAEIVQQETGIIALEGINDTTTNISLEIEISFFQERIDLLDGLLINIGSITGGCGVQVLYCLSFNILTKLLSFVLE